MITGAPLRRQPQLDERAQRGPPLPAIERIVVPLDGSQVAERVLAWAVALAVTVIQLLVNVVAQSA